GLPQPDDDRHLDQSPSSIEGWPSRSCRVASVLPRATLSPQSSPLLALTVRKVGAIADPFGRDDHQRPGEAVDRRGVGGSKPGECGPCLLGGFAMITCLLQSRPRLIEFEALDDGRIRSWRPPAEVPGQVL